LKDQPLHLATVANMELQYRATSQFTFFCVAMLGRIETLDNDLPEVKERDIPLLRFLTPILKVWSAKNAFAMSQEAMECFGGQGYMEETGIGRAMRDILVNTIWEGTSNVLSLDVLRVMAETGGDALELYCEVRLCARLVRTLRNKGTRNNCVIMNNEPIDGTRHHRSIGGSTSLDQVCQEYSSISRDDLQAL